MNLISTDMKDEIACFECIFVNVDSKLLQKCIYFGE